MRIDMREHATRIVRFHIDADAEIKAFWADTARRVMSQPHESREAAITALAATMKAEYSHCMPDLPGFWGELIRLIFREIDWRYVAESRIEGSNE